MVLFICRGHVQRQQVAERVNRQADLRSLLPLSAIKPAAMVAPGAHPTVRRSAAADSTGVEAPASTAGSDAGAVDGTGKLQKEAKRGCREVPLNRRAGRNGQTPREPAQKGGKSFWMRHRFS